MRCLAKNSWTARCDPASHFVFNVATVPASVASIILIWRHAVTCLLSNEFYSGIMCLFVTYVFTSVFCKCFLNKLVTFTYKCVCLWPQASREVAPPSAFLWTRWNWRGADVTSLFLCRDDKTENELLKGRKFQVRQKEKHWEIEVEKIVRWAAKDLPVKWWGDWGTNCNRSAGTFYFHHHVLNDPGVYSVS
jgi:hypothetical protein